MQCIYVIINKTNFRRYVGSARSFYSRKRQHLRALRNNNHHSRYLQRAWNKYGEASFFFEVLEEVENKRDLIPREQHWIDTLKPSYNMCKIAGSSLGIKRTKQTKERIRKANLGINHPEWRNKLKSEYQTGRKRKKVGRKGRQNMSLAQKKLFANGYKHPNRKEIHQYDKNNNFIKTWESITEASKMLNIHRESIGRCARGLSKTGGGFKWLFTKSR